MLKNLYLLIVAILVIWNVYFIKTNTFKFEDDLVIIANKDEQLTLTYLLNDECEEEFEESSEDRDI